MKEFHLDYYKEFMDTLITFRFIDDDNNYEIAIDIKEPVYNNMNIAPGDIFCFDKMNKKDMIVTEINDIYGLATLRTINRKEEN